MDCKNYNIKLVEGNAFALLFPLKTRTFVSHEPIDEDIDILALTDIVVKVGGVEYQAEQLQEGLLIRDDGTLPRGTYNIDITAEYYDNAIHAAYFEALTIVAFNEQSDAQQYVQGSPIVLPAAYCIYSLTDAELEQLKQDLRGAIADAEAAEEAAEAAKEHYDELAEQLSGVAQEQTLTDGVTAIRDDISHIDIDTSDLAKETSVKDGNDTAIGMLKDASNGLAAIKSSAASASSNATLANLQTLNIINSVGTPASGQPSTIFGAIAGINIDTSTLAKQGTNTDATLTDTQSAAEAAKTAAQALPTLQQMKEAGMIPMSFDGVVFQTPYQGRSWLEALSNQSAILSVKDSTITTLTILPKISDMCEVLEMDELYETSGTYVFRNQTSVKKMIFPKLHYSYNQTWMNCGQLRELIMPRFDTLSGYVEFQRSSVTRLIKIETGAYLNGNCNFFDSWAPSEALRSDSTSLVDEGETFTSNLEKLLYNIRTYFAANLPDRTGLSPYTMTLHANMKAAIQADTTTANAFANKNWIIA